MIKQTNPHVEITNERTGQIWTIFYQEAHPSNTNTVIEVPFGATYTVSGDNVGGFVVAYTVPKS